MILFWRKKKISFNCLMIWGGKKKKKNISAPFSSFYSKGEKISLRFLTLVAPLGTLLSFISSSLLMDDESILSLKSFLFLFSFVSFCHFGWIGHRGMGKELLIDMCHPPCFFSGSSSTIPSIHSSHILCVNIVFPRFVYFLCFSYKNVLPYALKLLMKK